MLAPSLGPCWQPEVEKPSPSSIATVVAAALIFLPGLVAAGAFLATAFARFQASIGRLYAVDLIGAALACLAAIPLMRQIEGPAAILVPVLLAALAGLATAGEGRRLRLVGAALAGLALGGSVVAARTDGNLLDLQNAGNERVIIERWNEHSRIVVVKAPPGYYIIIDKSAGAFLPPTPPRAEGAPVPARPWWDRSASYLAYRLGRTPRRVAIIGVGGGRDLLAPLKNGATEVHGYEMNQLLIDLLRRDFAKFNRLASWPEVSLVHAEGRTAVAHAEGRYDVIQASLTDTWASTAAGGMVLSENGLYTVEAWRAFISKLGSRGILTMTRWYVRRAPAETHRLVALATAALVAEGVDRPRQHVALVAQGTLATILVSRAPFSQQELERLRSMASAEKMSLLAAPGVEPRDPVIDGLLDPVRRAAAIAASHYDISAPSDQHPYFFLLYRPGDLLEVFRGSSGVVLQSTFRAMRVLAVLGAVAVGFALLVFILALLTLPSATKPSAATRRTYRWMSLYFLGLGLGYILVQLGLHQCLILLLGHPTLALSVVLFSMLVGTGIGASVSHRLFGERRLFARAWLAILVAVAVLVLALPAIYRLGALSSGTRTLAAGAILLVVGFVLGFGFPLGVRLVGATGEWAVQKMWAVNGAASIAGSAVAAVVGVSVGARAVLIVGFCCYVVVGIAGLIVSRAGPPSASGAGRSSFARD